MIPRVTLSDLLEISAKMRPFHATDHGWKFGGGAFAVEHLHAVDKLDGFQPTNTDRRDSERQFPQLKGQFLIDRESVVRWVNIEGAQAGPAGIGKFPSDQELLAAVHILR